MQRNAARLQELRGILEINIELHDRLSYIQTLVESDPYLYLTDPRRCIRDCVAEFSSERSYFNPLEPKYEITITRIIQSVTPLEFNTDLIALVAEEYLSDLDEHLERISYTIDTARWESEDLKSHERANKHRKVRIPKAAPASPRLTSLVLEFASLNGLLSCGNFILHYPEILCESARNVLTSKIEELVEKGKRNTARGFLLKALFIEYGEDFGPNLMPRLFKMYRDDEEFQKEVRRGIEREVNSIRHKLEMRDELREFMKRTGRLTEETELEKHSQESITEASSMLPKEWERDQKACGIDEENRVVQSGGGSASMSFADDSPAIETASLPEEVVATKKAFRDQFFKNMKSAASVQKKSTDPLSCSEAPSTDKH